MEKDDVKRYPINFSDKQVSKPHEHTGGVIDKKNGKPLLMVKLYIPSKDYRPKDVDFGIDQNGIDLNERKGYINLPFHNVFKDKTKEGRMYTYLPDDRKVKINFVGEKTGKIVNGKPEFDQPEKLELDAKEFAHLYDGVERTKAKDKSKEKASEQTKEKTQTKSKDKSEPSR